MSTGNRTDPYRAYNFKLEIGGETQGHFTECSGLNIKVQSISYKEAGTSTVHKLPGPVEYGDITLKYGMTSSTMLWDWMMKTANGQLERKNVSIKMIDNDGTSLALQWNLIDAWPSGWDAPALNATSQEAAIETMTITYESLNKA